MKILKIKELKNSFLLKTYNDFLLVKNVEKKQISAYTHNFKHKWSLNINRPSGKFLSYDKSNFIYYENMTSVFVDLSNGKIKKKENRVYLNINKNYKVYIDVLKKDEMKFDFPFKSIIIKPVVGQKIFLKDYFIQDKYKEKSVFCQSLINNKQWQHNYSDLFGSNYKSITPTNLINIKEKLYVCFGRTTFCIDIETGNITHTYKDYFSVAENKYLYGLKPTSKRTNFYITILNTITQKIERIDILDELKKYNIYTDQNFTVQNGLVYFKQSMGADVARVGILDPKTAKLIWKYDFPKGSGQVGSIQVQGDIIYAHTQDQTLHIFEKQQTPH